jgi:hypothetical protein
VDASVACGGAVYGADGLRSASGDGRPLPEVLPLADVDLRGVDARLREDLPTLALQRMQGRIGWRQVDQGIEVSADKLSMRLADGFSLRPTTFLFNLMPASGYRSASGEIRADVCSACHPFYTGKQKIVDTAGRLH